MSRMAILSRLLYLYIIIVVQFLRSLQQHHQQLLLQKLPAA